MKCNVKTPMSLVEKMMEKLNLDKYIKDILNLKVCDICCKDISYVVYFAETIYDIISADKRLCKKYNFINDTDIYNYIFNNIVYGFCLDETDYILIKRFIKKVYDVDATTIYFKNVLKEEMCDNIKKFDICVMNPPYSTKKNATYAPRTFLLKGVEIADTVVGVMPIGRIFGRGRDSCAQLIEKFNKNGVDVETINPEEYFDAFLPSTVCIIKYDKYDITKNIIKDNEIYSSIYEIKFQEKKELTNFKTAIESAYTYDCMMCHIKYANLGKRNQIVNFLRYNKYIVHNPDKNKYVIAIADRTGKGKILPIERIRKGIFSEVFKESKTTVAYFQFDTEYELNNFINYLKSDFARAAVCITQCNNHILGGELDTVPWFDFTEEIFSKTPREIDNYLFKKFNISDEQRSVIENMLEDIYKIR